MPWTEIYTYKGLKVWIEYNGVIGFKVGDEDSEVAQAIKNNDPRILEALAYYGKEFPEIAIVHNILDLDFTYYVGNALRFSADLETLDSVEKDLTIFLTSKYAPEGRKNEAREWLGKVIAKREKVLRRKVKEKRPSSENQGYIYLIKAETGHYKIGRTKSIPDRMNFFGIKLPFKVELLKAIPVDDMYYFETWLHKWFEEFRVNGEWFALDEISVSNLIKLENQADLEDYIACMTAPSNS